MVRKLAATAAVLALLAVTTVSIALSRPRAASAVARLRDVNGGEVGVVRLKHARGHEVKVAVRVEDVEPADQFHGFHVHAVGECDPESVDPATGEVVPFFSAGGHFNPTSDIHGDHAGDFPVLLVDEDGSAWARFVTDRFEISDLFDDDGSAVIVHAGKDNYANIPATTPDGAERYHSHLEDVLGPDSLTQATGDAGSRFACGVVKRAD
jgi:Cu-Zn family superoxide dismutase